MEAEKYIKQGALIPDESMIQCILDELKTVKGSVMLDGFPRTKVQAEKLWEVQKIDSVINLIVPYEIIVDRVKVVTFIWARVEFTIWNLIRRKFQ